MLGATLLMLAAQGWAQDLSTSLTETPVVDPDGAGPLPPVALSSGFAGIGGYLRYDVAFSNTGDSFNVMLVARLPAQTQFVGVIATGGVFVPAAQPPANPFTFTIQATRPLPNPNLNLTCIVLADLAYQTIYCRPQGNSPLLADGQLPNSSGVLSFFIRLDPSIIPGTIVNTLVSLNSGLCPNGGTFSAAGLPPVGCAATVDPNPSNNNAQTGFAKDLSITLTESPVVDPDGAGPLPPVALSSGNAGIGGYLRYDLRFRNTGDSINVMLVARLPAQTQFVGAIATGGVFVPATQPPASPFTFTIQATRPAPNPPLNLTCIVFADAGDQTIYCRPQGNLPLLADGQLPDSSGVLTYFLRLDPSIIPGTVLTTLASINSGLCPNGGTFTAAGLPPVACPATVDPNPGNNNTLTGFANDLSTTQTTVPVVDPDGAGPLAPVALSLGSAGTGGYLRYDVAFRNTGDSINVMLVARLPGQTQFVGAIAAGGVFVPATQPPASPFTFTIQATRPAPNPRLNLTCIVSSALGAPPVVPGYSPYVSQTISCRPQGNLPALVDGQLPDSTGILTFFLRVNLSTAAPGTILTSSSSIDSGLCPNGGAFTAAALPPVACAGTADPNPSNNTSLSTTAIPTVPITINTSPTELTFSFGGACTVFSIATDGTAFCQSPQTIHVSPGRTYVLDTPSPQGGPSARFVFTNWSDGVITKSRQIDVTTTATYTANFTIENPPFDSPFQVRYFSNLNLGDSVINITNSGARGASLAAGTSASTTGAICANVYVFSPDEQMVSCCSCPVTPNGLVSLSVRQDLISNTLTPAVPTSIVVKLLASTPLGGSCQGSASSPGALVFGMLAWGTAVHASAVTGGVPAITESSFLSASLSKPGGRDPAAGNELNRLTQLCTFINSNGSGFGLCRSCSLGALGAGRQ